jgi:drug/metabolite transporter (DMT)-like permease
MSERTTGAGLSLALISAATFGTAGTFASSLLNTGWSPAAAVTARITIAALVLTGPALWQARGSWDRIRANAGTIAIFGLVAVAACQLCYFNAVSRMSVSVALLLEYLGVVLVVGWMWVRHGHRPRRLTIAGAAFAIAGLVLVLDITGGAHLDPVGVMWGLLAAVGLALYFVVSASSDDGVPPIVIAWGGMLVGAVTFAVLGGIGVLDLHASTSDVTFMHRQVSWLVPVVGLSIVAAAVAYVAGIAGTRLLGAKVASFVGLTEVLFAAFFAWVFLGELPATIQIAGGVLVIAGVALVRIDELHGDAPTAIEPELVTASPVAG